MTATASRPPAWRTGPRARAVLLALLVLAGLIWYGESALFGVLSRATQARVRDMRERIVYDDGTQARHVFEIEIDGPAPAPASTRTLAVDAASFDALAPDSVVTLRELNLAGAPITRLSTQPLNGGMPPWLKILSVLAVLLWATLALPRLRPILLAAAAVGLIAFVANRASAQAAISQAALRRADATVQAVRAVQINRGGNDEGARYLFAIDDQLVLPEALVDGAFVELAYTPENRARPVIAVDVLRADQAKVGDAMQVTFPEAAPRAARAAQSTRGVDAVGGGLNPWWFALAGCALLAGMEWLGRRLAADAGK